MLQCLKQIACIYRFGLTEKAKRDPKDVERGKRTKGEIKKQNPHKFQKFVAQITGFTYRVFVTPSLEGAVVLQVPAQVWLHTSTELQCLLYWIRCSE